MRARLDRLAIHDIDQVAVTDHSAAALDTWDEWGTETITFTDPGQAIKVAARMVGGVIHNNATAGRRTSTGKIVAAPSCSRPHWARRATLPSSSVSWKAEVMVA